MGRDAAFVDALREWLDLAPLYAADKPSRAQLHRDPDSHVDADGRVRRYCWEVNAVGPGRSRG